MIQAAGGEALDWNEQGLDVNTNRLAALGVDIAERERILQDESRAEEEAECAAKEAARDADPNFHRYDCCGSNSDIAVVADVQRHLDPDEDKQSGFRSRDKGDRMLMPDTCPVCDSPTRDGFPSNQPEAQDYLCGSWAYACGHVIYHGSERAMCEYIASLKGRAPA